MNINGMSSIGRSKTTILISPFSPQNYGISNIMKDICCKAKEDMCQGRHVGWTDKHMEINSSLYIAITIGPITIFVRFVKRRQTWLIYHCSNILKMRWKASVPVQLFHHMSFISRVTNNNFFFYSNISNSVPRKVFLRGLFFITLKKTLADSHDIIWKLRQNKL